MMTEQTTYCTAAVVDVLKERLRQINAEGFTPEYDDGHASFDMPKAAASYCLSAARYAGVISSVYGLWPWSRKWWKPTTPRRDLVKAAALILAEIDRLDRATMREQPK